MDASSLVSAWDARVQQLLFRFDRAYGSPLVANRVGVGVPVLWRHYYEMNGDSFWSVDRPEREDRQCADYWPGAEYLYIASLHAYEEFKQSYHDDLLEVAAHRPLALAEAGRVPSIEVLNAQPGWTWWMTWAGMFGGRPGQGTDPMQTLVNDPRSWSVSDPDYIEAIA